MIDRDVCDFKAQYEARKTPEDWRLAVLDGGEDRLNLVAAEATGQVTKYPTPKLRGENLLLLVCKAGQPVEVTLRNRPISRYKSLLFWELRDPNMKQVACDKIAYDQVGAVRVNILDPSGQQVASGQTSRRTSSVEVEVSVGSSAGATWSLQLTRADEGTLEDFSVKLDSKLPPVLSLVPQQVFHTRSKRLRNAWGRWMSLQRQGLRSPGEGRGKMHPAETGPSGRYRVN